jgi:hypothetical protein
MPVTADRPADRLIDVILMVIAKRFMIGVFYIMLDSSAVKVLLSTAIASFLLLTMSSGGRSTQSEAPELTGRWELEFTVRSTHHRLRFDAQASGEGTFLSLDSTSDLERQFTPTKALWRLRGQSTAIYFFSISGQAELPAINGGRELAGLDFQAISDLSLPITSLRGWGQYHPPRDPDDARGSEDPTFDFTGKRVNEVIVQLLLPNSGRRLRRGKEAIIEWAVQTDLPLASQTVLISLDGGDNFIVIAPFVDGNARRFVWAVPEEMPRTKKALLKVVAVDQFGQSAEGLSAQIFRIK